MKNITDIKKLVRPNIQKLKAYSSARSEFTQKANIYLDANENPFDNGVNRYPDPLQNELKKMISKYKGQPVEKIFLGNGSDEVLDVIVRTFCEPGQDDIIINPPTYGMYSVIAAVNNINVKEVFLQKNFCINEKEILEAAGEHTKMLILCSPNNPTGNVVELEKIEFLLQYFPGLVLVDEAYIDFSPEHSAVSLLDNYPNLIVTQTLSKAWAMAGLRIGMAFAHPGLVQIFNKVKPPYNISTVSQEKALQILSDTRKFKENLKRIEQQKVILTAFLKSLDNVTEVIPSDANFVSARFKNAGEVYQKLIEKGIVVRNRSNQPLCENCLRITVGTEEEMAVLIETLKNLKL